MRGFILSDNRDWRLFEALAGNLCLHQNPQIPAKFLVIGDGELRDELIEYCQKHGISNEVLFCGWKRDLPHIYADLDILALTSVNEGTPVSIIEAMASRFIPCLTHAPNLCNEQFERGAINEVPGCFLLLHQLLLSIRLRVRRSSKE